LGKEKKKGKEGEENAKKKEDRKKDGAKQARSDMIGCGSDGASSLRFIVFKHFHGSSSSNSTSSLHATHLITFFFHFGALPLLLFFLITLLQLRRPLPIYPSRHLPTRINPTFIHSSDFSSVSVDTLRSLYIVGYPV